MSITATELKNNLGKYLSISVMEDVFITKNGKIVAKLTNPYQDRVDTAKSLFGILPENARAIMSKLYSLAGSTRSILPNDFVQLVEAKE